MGPIGNEQGGHCFMSLATGWELSRNQWMELPMPCDAISRVNALGLKQSMPKTLTFANRFGHEIIDADDEVDDEHDSDYDPSDDSSRSSDTSDNSSQSTQLSASTASLASTDTDDSDDDDDDDDNDDGGNTRPIVRSSVGVGGTVDKDNHDNGLDKNDDEEDDNSDYEDDDDSDADDNSDDDDSSTDQKEDDKDNEGSDCGNKRAILVLDVTIASPDSKPKNEDRPARSPGVCETGAVPAQSPGVG